MESTLKGCATITMGSWEATGYRGKMLSSLSVAALQFFSAPTLLPGPAVSISADNWDRRRQSRLWVF